METPLQMKISLINVSSKRVTIIWFSEFFPCLLFLRKCNQFKIICQRDMFWGGKFCSPTASLTWVSHFCVLRKCQSGQFHSPFPSFKKDLRLFLANILFSYFRQMWIQMRCSWHELSHKLCLFQLAISLLPFRAKSCCSVEQDMGFGIRCGW